MLELRKIHRATIKLYLEPEFSRLASLLIDDHSTDNTAVVVKGFSKKDQRIAYHLRNRLPKGAQTCRNMGLSLASDSEYVIFSMPMILSLLIVLSKGFLTWIYIKT